MSKDELAALIAHHAGMILEHSLEPGDWLKENFDAAFRRIREIADQALTLPNKRE